jgi:hypothetical protein
VASLGLPSAEPWIAAARARASEAGIDMGSRFVFGDTETPNAPARVVVAIGVFEDEDDPEALLDRLHRLAERDLVTSFPKAGTWRSALRSAWGWISDINVRAYTVAEIQALVEGWAGEAKVVESGEGDLLLHWRREA